MKALLKKISLLGNWEIFIETVKRFPLSSICGILSFCLAVYAIHNKASINEEIIGRLVLSFALGYLWFGICQIYSEAKKLDAIKHGALAIIGFAPLLFITFGSTDEFFRLFFIFPALLLLIMVAPYILRRSNDESFWVFNRHVWFGVAISYIAAVLLAGGIAAALAAVKYLFGVKIPDELWGDIFAFCGLVLGPIYALSFVPSKFDYQDEECHTPDQVGFIVNWILAPLVLVYMAILYAYFIKIGVMQEIPKGQLSYMIVGFLGAGLVTYIVSWPLQKTGSRALKLISKFFFAAMIVPVVMQAVSIWMRIDQYGFTEKRYIVAMSVLWFAFIAIGFLTKKLQLKHIPLSLAILLLLGSWGPWSARDISASSQLDRLEKVLTENNLLKDGKVLSVPKGEELSYEARKNISGIADYVFRHKHEFHGFANQYKFFEKLGFNHVSKWDRKRNVSAVEFGRFNFNFNNRNYNKPIDVREADFYIQNLRIQQKVSSKVKPLVYAEFKDTVITITLQDYSTVLIDVSAELQKLIDGSALNGQRSLTPVEVSGENEKYKVRLKLRSILGEIKDGKPEIQYMNASAFIKEK